MSLIVVLISADIEWRALCELFPSATLQSSPYGAWFYTSIDFTGSTRFTVDHLLEEKHLAYSVVFFHGGWGKIAASGSTQYVIDRWKPALLINLGTCGGFEGKIERDQIVLADRTIVYDIIEQMGDFDEHILHYSTTINLDWLGENLPLPVFRTLLVSADRDLIVQEIPCLHEHFGAVAGDWESGAIAWVADRNQTRLLILRGVTDLVGPSGGEAYGNIQLFAQSTSLIMQRLVGSLPGWIKFLK